MQRRGEAQLGVQLDGQLRRLTFAARTAPFDGVVTGVLVVPGDRLEVGAALLTLTPGGANCDND